MVCHACCCVLLRSAFVLACVTPAISTLHSCGACRTWLSSGKPLHGYCTERVLHCTAICRVCSLADACAWVTDAPAAPTHRSYAAFNDIVLGNPWRAQKLYA